MQLFQTCRLEKHIHVITENIQGIIFPVLNGINRNDSMDRGPLRQPAILDLDEIRTAELPSLCLRLKYMK